MCVCVCVCVSVSVCVCVRACVMLSMWYGYDVSLQCVVEGHLMDGRGDGEGDADASLQTDEGIVLSGGGCVGQHCTGPSVVVNWLCCVVVVCVAVVFVWLMVA